MSGTGLTTDGTFVIREKIQLGGWDARAMLEYRLFPLDKSDHICGPPDSFECPSDEAAIERSKVLINGHDVALWQRDRLVIRLQSPPK